MPALRGECPIVRNSVSLLIETTPTPASKLRAKDSNPGKKNSAPIKPISSNPESFVGPVTFF
jgi:hypothetical protein